MKLCEETASVQHTWFLSEIRSDGQQALVISFRNTPTTIGRESADILLKSMVVSKIHARLGVNEEYKPFVEDLKSTNGTFVNNEKVKSAVLKHGDVVRFADRIFRVNQAEDVESTDSGPPPAQPQVIARGTFDAKQSQSSVETKSCSNAITWTSALLQFEQLMTPNAVQVYCQPVVEMSDGSFIGYECLSRSTLTDLELPDAMFDAASQLDNASELSEFLRRSSVEACSQLENPGMVFLNSHPTEGFGFRFEQSLRELRRSAPGLKIAIELKEEVVNDHDAMAKFRDVLNELDMNLVYDDFGADQERLNQLIQVPPDYLKFDIAMIRNIDAASDHHRNLVRALVQAIHGMGIVSVAEGVETQGEAEVCREIGFQLAQGFFFGRPEPIVQKT